MTEAADREARHGLIAGTIAYGLWGLLPIFFGLLHHVAPVEVVAQRIIWSLLLILAVLVVRRRLGALGAVLRSPRTLAALAMSAALIAGNWLTYVWAVQADHVLGASLGYFLNPLVVVLLGVAVLKERLRRGQVIAILIAAAGVVLMALSALSTLWISVMLAVSFAIYGLVRKLTPVEAFAGLGAETLLLFPFAIGWCLWSYAHGTMDFSRDGTTNALLIACGAVTTVPLVLFAVAARQLPMATLGLLQYIAPTLQFLCGLLLFDETLSRGQVMSFALIWLGLILFAADSYATARRNRLATV